MVEILLIILILIVILVLIANNKPNYKVNSYIFLIFGLIGFGFITMEQLFGYTIVADYKKYDFPILSAEMAFVAVCLLGYYHQRTKYRHNKLQEMISATSREHSDDKEQEKDTNNNEQSVDNVGSKVIDDNKGLSNSDSKVSAKTPFHAETINKIISTNYDKLSEQKKKIMKWVEKKVSDLFPKENQKDIIIYSLCFMEKYEYPSNLNAVPKVQSVSQNAVCEICSAFRAIGKTSSECVAFAKTVFANYFLSDSNIEDNQEHKLVPDEYIKKKLNSPNTFVLQHEDLFTEERVKQAKEKRNRNRGE